MIINERVADGLTAIRRYTTKGGHSIAVLHFDNAAANEDSYEVVVEQELDLDVNTTSFHEDKQDAVKKAQFLQWMLENSYERS